MNSFIIGTILTKDIFGRSHLDANQYAKLDVGDEMFNNTFRVYTDNKEITEINPLLLKNISKLNDTIKGQLLFSFMNNELHVGINKAENVLEPKGIFRKINEEKAIEKMQNEFELIKVIIDDIVLKSI